MTTIREELIRAGVISPRRPVPGEPTAQGWLDEPTLRLDPLGKRTVDRQRQERKEDGAW